MALDREITGVVIDGDGAGAGILGDLSRDDIDERGPVVVAVPRHFAAWSNLKSPHTEVMACDCHFFVCEIEFAEQLLCHCFMRCSAGLLPIGCDDFICRAFARARRIGNDQECARQCTSER